MWNYKNIGLLKDMVNLVLDNFEGGSELEFPSDTMVKSFDVIKDTNMAETCINDILTVLEELRVFAKCRQFHKDSKYIDIYVPLENPQSMADRVLSLGVKNLSGVAKVAQVVYGGHKWDMLTIDKEFGTMDAYVISEFSNIYCYSLYDKEMQKYYEELLDTELSNRYVIYQGETMQKDYIRLINVDEFLEQICEE